MYDVALSFAGEDREYVEKVASILRDMGLRVFYDKYEAVSLWGRNLYIHLREVYQKLAKYTVMFISKNYAGKLWTNHERESAQARAFSEHQEYILPARFDDTEIPGILPTIGYVNLEKNSPEELAEMIKQKVGPIERVEFFPEHPDRLNAYLKITEKKEIEEAYTIAEGFFKTFKLMSPVERWVLATIVINTCPVDLPKNVHVNLDYLSRLVSLSRDEIIELFSRLDCLGMISKIRPIHSCEGGEIKKLTEIIEVKWEPLYVKYPGNKTYIMGPIFKCITENSCPECAKRAIEHADFSILSTLASFPEDHGG